MGVIVVFGELGEYSLFVSILIIGDVLFSIVLIILE